MANRISSNRKSVSGNYFAVLGVPATAGRTLTAGDDDFGAGPPVAVISHRYWTRRFGQDPSRDRTHRHHRTLRVHDCRRGCAGIPRRNGRRNARCLDAADSRCRQTCGRVERPQHDMASSRRAATAWDHHRRDACCARTDLHNHHARDRRGNQDCELSQRSAAKPAGHRRSGVAAIPPCASVSPVPLRADGGCRAGPADCLRQRCQSSAGARGRACARNLAARRAWRRTPSPGPAAFGRVAAAVGARRNPGSAARALGRRQPRRVCFGRRRCRSDSTCI